MCDFGGQYNSFIKTDREVRIDLVESVLGNYDVKKDVKDYYV